MTLMLSLLPRAIASSMSMAAPSAALLQLHSLSDLHLIRPSRHLFTTKQATSLETTSQSTWLSVKKTSHIPIDLEVAKTPKTREPFQFMTLPPAASILFLSSGLSGCVLKKMTYNRMADLPEYLVKNIDSIENFPTSHGRSSWGLPAVGYDLPNTGRRRPNSENPTVKKGDLTSHDSTEIFFSTESPPIIEPLRELLLRL
ncbi:hypothetical protein CRG98_034292 [Punica granatum]|uniref:Uncharacterized protein n=1 Tax=Punica granatum TaxID=22663 RepID=A0A2I0IMU2_PUNGR|nr:hypothetical protein CRG98_034292 [Punica granatum]